MKLVVGIVAVYLTAAPPSFSQEQADLINYETARLSRVATAVRATERVTLDGKLEEPTWKQAIPATDFIGQNLLCRSPEEDRRSMSLLGKRIGCHKGLLRVVA